MTLRHLMILRAICENGCNTTRAAEALHMTQPAVSLALRELETYYGTMLFERIGRRLQITQSGRRFLSYATHILSLYEEMEKSMRDWDALGVIRVGASITIGSQFLPGYVKAFSARHPGTQVQALVMPSDVLEEKLIKNELDFALIEGHAHNEDIVSTAYMDDELVAICPADGKFAFGQTLCVDEFRRLPFLLRERGSGTRDVFDRAAAQAGFSVVPVWEAMSTTALVRAVASGLGAAVLPARMVRGAVRSGQVVPVRVEGMDFHRRFHIIHHRQKHLTSAMRAFIELCVHYEEDYPLPEYGDLF